MMDRSIIARCFIALVVLAIRAHGEVVDITGEVGHVHCTRGFCYLQEQTQIPDLLETLGGGCRVFGGNICRGEMVLAESTGLFCLQHGRCMHASLFILLHAAVQCSVFCAQMDTRSWPLITAPIYVVRTGLYLSVVTAVV